MNWEIGIDMYTIPCIKQTINENLLYAQGTLLTSLWRPKWEGNLEKKEYMYTESWSTLLYNRN